MATNQDYYSILEVSKSATLEEIKKAYRQQALKWHPDKHTGEEKQKAEARFKEVNQAYEVLKDPQKRQMYDQVGHNAYSQQGSGFGGGNQYGGQQGPFRYSYSSNVNTEDMFGGFSDPFDIFEQFFGGGGFSRQTARKPVYSIELNFMDAVKGAKKEVSMGGSRREIKIPAGVDDNTRIRFSEFDILVKVRPHESFKRQGYDIIVDVVLSFSVAALGGSIEVPTIDGDLTLKIRPGTQPGTLVRLRGKGVPHPQSTARGDEYVRITIAVPKSLSRRQKELLQEFENS